MRRTTGLPLYLFCTIFAIGSAVPVFARTDEVAAGYIKVTDSCSADWSGVCLTIRTGPGTDYRKVSLIRKGAVLRYDRVTTADDGSTWYRIKQDSWVRYADRVADNWYVSGDYVTVTDIGNGGEVSPASQPSVHKKIVIVRSTQTLSAYEDGEKVFSAKVSTGIATSKTPRGSFIIFKKTPSRYMQGPIPGITKKEFDLPGVPWNMYFTEQGAAIHGAYWHENFGKPWSNGCVNLPPEKAETLYRWATLGTRVVVVD